MPKLFVLGGPDVGHSFDVRPGTVLGRHPDCAVQVHDRSVSRRHARIEVEGSRWFVVDLGSRNGVHVAGERTERAELTDRAEFLLGELPLRFRLDPAEVEQAAAPAPPVAMPPPRPAPPRPAPPPPPRRRIATPPPEEGGIELEEEIDLTSLAETRDRPVPERSPSMPELTAREIERARLLRENAGGSGLFGGDLAQRPLWVQVLAYAFVVAVAGGLFYGAYKVVQMMRESL